MRTIRVRNLTFQEVAALGEDDSFLVPCSQYQEGDIVPFVRARTAYPDASSEDRKILERREAISMPTLLVRDEYHSCYGVSANKLYVEDPEGDPAHLVEACGTKVCLSLYAHGMDGPDVLERIHRALRDEFGVGFLRVCQENHRMIPEADQDRMLGMSKI